MADEAQTILAPAPVDNTIKANAWEAFNSAQNENELGVRLQGINLPQDVKANLWEAKRRGAQIPGAPSGLPTLGTPIPQELQQAMQASPYGAARTGGFLKSNLPKEGTTGEYSQAASMASLPLVGESLVTNPLATLAGLGGGYGGGKAAKYGATKLGAAPFMQDVAEVGGNIVGGVAGGYAGGKLSSAIESQVKRLFSETPERIAELKQLPQTEEAIRGRVVQAEAQSRTAFKSAYNDLGIDAEPVKLADVRPIAKQAASQLPAYQTPRTISQVSNIPLPSTGDVQAQLGLQGETMHPEEILANLNKYDNIPFRQAQQYRTAIEQYITAAKPPATVYNSLKSVSNGIKSAMSAAADNVGKLDGLNAADSMMEQHAKDFWRKGAPLRPWVDQMGTPAPIQPNATGQTLNRFANVAQQARALEAIERRLGPQPELRAILSKTPKGLKADLRDAATLKNLGEPVLNQQVGGANKAMLKGYALKTGLGASGLGGLYELIRHLQTTNRTQGP